MSLIVEVLVNPRCSKCRQALAFLDDQGVAYQTREYLKDPLTVEELVQLANRLQLPPERWMREKVGSTEAERLQALASRPELLQRPIAVRGERAVVARSLTSLASLLEET